MPYITHATALSSHSMSISSAFHPPLPRKYLKDRFSALVNYLGFGSPNLALYSSSFGPSWVRIKPKKSTPLKGRPSSFIAFIVGSNISVSTILAILGVYALLGEKAPIPGVWPLVSVKDPLMILGANHGYNSAPITKG